MSTETSKYAGHMPGPWEAMWKRKIGYYVRTAYPVIDGAQVIICVMRDSHPDAPADKARTAATRDLIADAPTLLAERDVLRRRVEKLEAALRAIRGNDDGTMRGAIMERWIIERGGREELQRAAITYQSPIQYQLMLTQEIARAALANE